MTVTAIRTKPSKPVNESVGRIIRDLAFTKGVSQVQLALSIGVEQSSMSRRIHGRTDWAPDELVTVAEILEVPVARFFEGGVQSLPNRGQKD